MFAAVFVAALLVGGFVAARLGLRPTQLLPIPLLAAEVVTAAVVVPAAVLLQRRHGKRLRDLGLVVDERHLIRETAIGVGAGLAIKVATIPLGIFAYVAGVRGGIPAVQMDGTFDLLVYVTAGSLAAMVEEIAFRGYLRDRVARVLRDPRPEGSMWPTGVVTSIAFGLGHGWEGGMGLVVTTSVGLMLFGLVILRRTNLFHAIVAHAVFNATAFLTLAALPK